MPRSRVLTFGLLTALLASGYGVMFTVLDDFRDEYGIEAHWLGVIVGVGFFASFFAIGPHWIELSAIIVCAVCCSGKGLARCFL